MCRHCVEDLFTHYKSIVGEVEAIRRLCMKFDIYWSMEIYDMLNKSSTTNSRVLAYISKTNLYKFVGKTYDDTLDEEQAAAEAAALEDAPILSIEEAEEKGGELDVETVRFWGVGFLADEYDDLNNRYKVWSSGYECKTVAEESLLKQIVLAEWRITKETQRGGKVDGLINAFNALLGSANLKPVQNKEASIADQQNTFGTLIKVWENERPIPEPDEEFRDVDGIVRYISIWFLGHLCKMMKINNSYSRLYEMEMAKLRVEKPEYEDEEDEQLFDSLFGDGDES